MERASPDTLVDSDGSLRPCDLPRQVPGVLSAWAEIKGIETDKEGV